MSRNDLDALLLVLGGLVVLMAVLSWIAVPSRRQFVRPFLITVALSLAVYLMPPGIDGRDEFHRRLEIAIVLALVVGAISAARATRVRAALGRIAFCLLGAATPPLFLLSLLTVACWGTTECLG